jgi:hypothetical protein
MLSILHDVQRTQYIMMVDRGPLGMDDQLPCKFAVCPPPLMACTCVTP